MSAPTFLQYTASALALLRTSVFTLSLAASLALWVLMVWAVRTVLS